MMRICPKCGDYYADASLAFCLADGTPLINVDPLSERWSEGTRVIEEKGNALRKQKRKLKWRRIALSTMAVATLVVMVVAVNSFIAVEPGREENVAALPSPPETAPAEPVGSITPVTPVETSPTLPTNSTATGTPTPTPTITPTPTPVYKISGRVTKADGTAISGVNMSLAGSKSGTTTTDAGGNYSFTKLSAGGDYTVTLSKSNFSFTTLSRTVNNLDANQTANFTGVPVSYRISGRVTIQGAVLRDVSVKLSGSRSATLTTDKNGNYAFDDLLAGGSYTITPASAKIVFTPLGRSINKLTRDESADFVGTEQREQVGCSAIDKSLDEEAINAILYRYGKGKGWGRVIKGARPKITAENMPAGAPPGRDDVPNPRPTLGEIKFQIIFTKICTATVTASANLIGTKEAVTVGSFTCTKTGNAWRCRQFDFR